MGVTTLRGRLSSSRMNGVRFDSRPQRCTKTGDIKISSVAVGAIGWLNLQSSHSTISRLRICGGSKVVTRFFQASSQSSHTQKLCEIFCFTVLEPTVSL